MDMQSTFTTINQALKNNFHSVTSEEQKCIDDCLQCHAICEQLIPYCLDKGGMHAERIHLQKLWLCADICKTTAHFLMWGSDLHRRVCELCCEACLKCADDCDRMKDDKLLKVCADTCRTCADSCLKMAVQHQ